jgi:hypothetical protein
VLLMAPRRAFRQIVRGVWAHLLAYNLVRGAMAEAARRHRLSPRELSFQGARKVLEAFRGELGRAAGGPRRRCGRSPRIAWGAARIGWSRAWSSAGRRRILGCRSRGRSPEAV